MILGLIKDYYTIIIFNIMSRIMKEMTKEEYDTTRKWEYF